MKPVKLIAIAVQDPSDKAIYYTMAKEASYDDLFASVEAKHPKLAPFKGWKKGHIDVKYRFMEK